MKLVIVSGALANKPSNGGNAWSRLSWVCGLRQLGYDVVFVEQISSTSCIGSDGNQTAFRDSINLTYFNSVMGQFDLLGSSALICEHGKEVFGLRLHELRARAREATLLFNISGHLTQPELMSCVRHKVYYDDDPGFTQFWQAIGSLGSRLEGHDCFFTLGANMGAPECIIPTNGLDWRHTRPPAVLKDWPVQLNRTFDRFTTIANWRGAYGPIEYGGKRYGIKAHEFRKFIEMPQRFPHPFEIALQIHPGDRKDLEALCGHGWRIVEPKEIADSPDAFRRYVQTSGAEFSVAQGTYVDTNSGWFSDRTVRYLASGRPALVQNTGFSRNIPTGEGLLAFRTMEEAIEGAASIVRDYPRHCLAARRIAEEYFDSDKVIRGMLRESGIKV